MVYVKCPVGGCAYNVNPIGVCSNTVVKLFFTVEGNLGCDSFCTEIPDLDIDDFCE